MLQPAPASNMKGSTSMPSYGEGELAPEEGAMTDGESLHDPAKIAALGQALKAKRAEARDYRAECGIEQDWDEDEDFYQAIDGANPEGESNAKPSKPISADGSASSDKRVIAETRSSAFIPITRAYVDAGSARVADMLLPNDDKPWKLQPTPVSDAGPPSAMTQTATAAAGMTGSMPMPMAPGAQPQFADHALNSENAGMSPRGIGTESLAPVQLPAGVASSALSDEEKKAEAADKRIDDWMVECQWNGEARKIIEDAGKAGTGVLKGPFPVLRTVQKMVRDPATGHVRMMREQTIVPVSKRINYRNCFPAPDSGDNHQNGSYFFEFDSIGVRQLRKLANDPTYIKANVLKVLKEGPEFAWSTADAPTDDAAEGLRIGGTFGLWYFYGDLDRDTLLACGLTPEELGPDEDEQALASIPALVVMVNDTVIKASLNPMETGGFPYDFFCWQKRDGMPWGKGIARQMRTPQRMLNAAVRAMMDNAGFTSGPLWAIRESWIQPIDGVMSIGPRKGFRMTVDAPPTAKIQDAISFTNVESAVTELKLLVDMAKSFAEDATGLSMLLQGQQGDATDTAAGMTILNNNGSTVLRRIARAFDDGITEPHVRRYYAWLMENAGNEECKGDFLIDARGSSYLVERDLQNKTLNQLVPFFAQHPDVHPGRLAEEVATANRLNFKRFMLTEDEKKARDAKPPPVPVPVQVVQERNKGALELLKTKLAEEVKKWAKEFEIDEATLQKEWELGLADLETTHAISETNAKSAIAMAVMKLRAQMKDKAADRAVGGAQRIADQNNSDEPPGRAPNHEAAIA